MATKSLSFWIDGEAVPKQSFRVGKGGGYTPARVKAWQAQVAAAAQMRMIELGLEPLTETVRISLIFILPNYRPKDSDNLSKAVLDGMNGIVFEDDHQCYDLRVRKIVSQLYTSCVYVHISETTEEEILSSFIRDSKEWETA